MLCTIIKVRNIKQRVYNIKLLHSLRIFNYQEKKNKTKQGYKMIYQMQVGTLQSTHSLRWFRSRFFNTHKAKVLEKEKRSHHNGSQRSKWKHGNENAYRVLYNAWQKYLKGHKKHNISSLQEVRSPDKSI